MCILFTLVLSELLLVYLSIRYFYTALCCCLFISLSPYFFILTLLLYFCLFVNHVNNSIVFVFVAFVYHFKITISISIFVISYCVLKKLAGTCWQGALAFFSSPHTWEHLASTRQFHLIRLIAVVFTSSHVRLHSP